MKKYIINHYGQHEVMLSICSYRPLPHCETPLAIEVLCPAEEEDDEEDGPYMESYGTLTVNMDPYTGRKDQGENRAFIKTYSENDPWAMQLINALKEEGIARYAGKMVQGGFGQTLPLYEFDLEKLRAVAVPDYE